MTPTKTPIRNIAIAALIVLLQAVGAYAQSYTIMPQPFGLVQDDSGHIVNGGCVWTYLAGTTTAATTYIDNVGTQNTNPIKADAAGRFTAYLVAGTSYKFVYENTPCTVSPPVHGTVLRSADGIAGVPASAATVDITGTAGETISATQAVYLSDGSGSKNAGQWYKADQSNTYSSTLPIVGIAPAAIASGASGTIRIAGSVPGFGALSTGSPYYVGVSGAITTTAPGLRRALGIADSATSIVLKDVGVPTQPWVDDFRLSLSTGTCVTTSDVTAATTLYLTPCNGNRIDLPDSSGNPQRVTTAELSIAVPATTSQMYTVWAYLNGSTPTLELLAWTNDTTPCATCAPVRTNGRLLKSGDSTRLFVGNVRTTAVSGQTEDSAANRLVWNMYNRVPRFLRRNDPTDNWTYTTATMRQANASTANQITVVVGVAETPVYVEVTAQASNTNGGVQLTTAIGEDSTTTPATGGQVGRLDTAVAQHQQITARLTKYPAVGYHTYTWLERSAATGTTTWYGDNTDATLEQSGMSGWIQG